jgi:outer membrane lipoprotein carrier protein
MQYSIISILSLFLLVFLLPSLTAQEVSDPNATALLKKVQSKYDYSAGLYANFELIIESGDIREVQKGSLAQLDKKYHINIDNQLVISDGNTIWFFLKNRNEVQITDSNAGEESWMLNPANLLKVYEQQDKFIYAIVGEGNVKGQRATFIEFKPTDRNAEYSKIRIAINQRSNDLIHLIVFGKDGMRYNLEFAEIGPLTNPDAFPFTFIPANYPGVHIEDLRW